MLIIANLPGVGLVAYSPLGRGFLTGAFKQRSDLAEGDWRLQNPRFSEQYFEQNLMLVEKIKTLAELKQCTPAQLALAWLLHQQHSVVPIPGTRSSKRLMENALAAELVLTDAEMTYIPKQLGYIQVDIPLLQENRVLF